MTLPNWDALPIRTKRSRKRLYGVLAAEYSLTAWDSLPNNVKRSKIHLYNYIASAKNLEEYDELAKNNMRSTRLLYTYIKENASGSKPTLTVKVKDGDSNVSGATVTIGTTEKTTDASGETTFTLDYDNYLVEVEKSGYVDYEENIKFRANHKTFTIPLEAEPEPPASTGTVTVTCQDSEQMPFPVAELTLSTEQIDWDNVDYTKVVAVGITGDDGTCTLKEMDSETHGPTETTAQITYGTYYLNAYYEENGEVWEYEDTLVVDGDEEVTITLTAAASTGTVTVTCTMSGTTPVVGATVTLKQDSETVKTGTSGEGGVCVLEDVPYSTYTLEAEHEGMEYSGSLTVDGDETLTITLETPL